MTDQNLDLIASENEKVNIRFDQELESEEHENPENEKQDLSKYTLVDHLDEDVPIPGQEYSLFSFISPEGVMNCNIRALKFRGAYPTLDEAEKAAKRIEDKDKYFKIFIGETGKWLEFDPPATRVEREMSSNKEHQKILDAQQKQRMAKMNALAGKYKENIDKKDSGKKEKIEETKKASAANDIAEKQKAKKQESQNQTQAQNLSGDALRKASYEKTKERLRKRAAEAQTKKSLETLKDEDIKANLNEKVKIVHKASAEVTEKSDKIKTIDKNIENIKQLLAKKKAEAN